MKRNCVIRIILYKIVEYISLLFFSLPPKHLFMVINKLHRNTFIIYYILYDVYIVTYLSIKAAKMFSRSHSTKSGKNMSDFFLLTGVNVFLFSGMLSHLGWRLILVEQCAHFQLYFIIHLWVFLSHVNYR